MNAPVHPVAATPAISVDLGHRLIGQLMDRCARFEGELTKLLLVADRKANPRMLPSQKISAVRDWLGRPTAHDMTQRARGRVAVILMEAERLLALRAECAHSLLSVAMVDGEPVFLLRNAQASAEPLDRCVLVSASDMSGASHRLAQLANQLFQLLRPVAEAGTVSSPESVAKAKPTASTPAKSD